MTTPTKKTRKRQRRTIALGIAIQGLDELADVLEFHTGRRFCRRALEGYLTAKRGQLPNVKIAGVRIIERDVLIAWIDERWPGMRRTIREEIRPPAHPCASLRIAPAE